MLFACDQAEAQKVVPVVWGAAAPIRHPAELRAVAPTASHYATKKPLDNHCLGLFTRINSRQSKQGAHPDRFRGSPNSQRLGCRRRSTRCTRRHHLCT